MRFESVVPCRVERMAREAQRAQLGVGCVPDERTNVFDAVENKPHVAGKRAVAATVGLGRFFQNAEARSFVERGVGSREVAVLVHQRHAVAGGS